MNLGDTYGKSASTTTNTGFGKVKNQPGLRLGGIDKCLCLIPQRFVIEMVNPNWVIREDISEKERKYVLTELINRSIL